MTDLVARLRKLNPCGEPLLLHDDAVISQAADEIEWLRVRVKVLETAIRLIAEQDATLSVCDGNVTVEMDATLTDEERRAIRSGIAACEDITYGGEFDQPAADTLKALLERLG